MARLSSSTKLGNTGASSLLKSANTLANQINTYKDAQMAQDYSLSTKTADDLAKYQDYLQGRITSLNSTGSITDATKAVSMVNTLYSAIKTNGSADIQRENIQIMSGSGTLQDKANIIASQFGRAQAIGDMSLAQSLESQYYSVSQTIQYQAQQAADAGAALAKSGASSKAGGEEHIATNLSSALKQLNNDIQGAGQKNFNSTVAKWVSTNADTLKALGVVLPKGAQPNYFDIANGVAGAIYNAHMLAYQAELPHNPDVAQGYFNQAMSLANGDTKLSTLAGSKTVQQIQQAAANPGQFAYDQATGGFKQTQQTGYQVNPKTGAINPTYSGSIVQVATPQLTAQLAKLGLQFNGTNGKASNGQEVQATSSTPQWLRNILGPNGITNIFVGQNGTLQFQADSTGASGKAVYVIAKDNTGKYGAFQQDKAGITPIGGEYGFNQQVNTVINPKAVNDIHALANGQSGKLGEVYGNMNALGNTNARNLVNAGQQTQNQIATANAAAAKAMLSLAPPTLPNISIAPSTPLPPVTVSAPSAPQTRSVSQAQPVASPAISPQNPGGVNLQGGGGGIRLQ